MPDSIALSGTRIPLAGGTGTLPAVGFGTLIPDPAAASDAIKTALEVGYRPLDCVELYHNEDVAGRVMRNALEMGTVDRKELFVTTKLWNKKHCPDCVRPALEASLRRLQQQYADCYLIHTPFAFMPGDNQFPIDAHDGALYDFDVASLETWRATERCVNDGRCKFIGLSDIGLDRLQEIVAAARIKPALIQIEVHPCLPEWRLLDFCNANGIVMQVFAPLGHAMPAPVIEEPVIAAIAKRFGKTRAQVALEWAVQRGTAVLTTSVSSDHIRENFEIFSLPNDALEEIRYGIAENIRFNAVLNTGVPGFVPRRD